MAYTSKRRIFCSVLAVFLLSWQLLHQLGVTDPTRFSHPAAVLLIFLDVEFLWGAAVQFSQVTVAVLFGGALGASIAAILIRNTLITRATSRFSRIILWLPFFLVPALPRWSIQSISLLLVIELAAISIFTYYDLIAVSRCLNLNLSAALLISGRRILLQALLFSVYAEPHSGVGWFTGSFQRPQVAYGALIVICAVILVINSLFRSSFKEASELHGQLLISETFAYRRESLIGAIIIGVGCLVIWQFAAGYSARYLLVGSPIDVFNTFYNMFFSSFVTMRQTYLGHFLSSSFEMFGGIIIAGGISLVLMKGIERSPVLHNMMSTLLPLMSVTPLITFAVAINWFRESSAEWRTGLGVALVVLYPLLTTLWGLRQAPVSFRVLSAVEQSLPLAFIAMLFGELWGASRGLGFAMVLARGEMRMNESIVFLLLTFSLFVTISTSLRFLAKLTIREPVELAPHLTRAFKTS